MKHFYLIANPSKPGALDMAEKLETEFLRRGASCVHTRVIHGLIRFRRIRSASSPWAVTEPSSRPPET